MTQTNNYGRRKWAGYTLAELRGQRELVNTRIAVERNSLADDVDELREKITLRSRPASVAGKMFSALSYLDWIILSVSFFRKIAPLFNRRKR